MDNFKKRLSTYTSFSFAHCCIYIVLELIVFSNFFCLLLFFLLISDTTDWETNPGA